MHDTGNDKPSIDPKEWVSQLKDCGWFDGLPAAAQTELIVTLTAELERGHNIATALESAYQLWPDESTGDTMRLFVDGSFGVLELKNQLHWEREEDDEDGLVTPVVEFECGGKAYTFEFPPQYEMTSEPGVIIVNGLLHDIGSDLHFHQMEGDTPYPSSFVLTSAGAIEKAIARRLIPAQLFPFL
jgi:hypothetical protein